MINLQRFGTGAARVVLCGFLVATLLQSSQAALTHRYSFTADASDSVGGANGTPQNGATISAGVATFSGTIPSGPACDYIDLPPGLISNYTAVTFEFWISASANNNWCEVFGFGNQTTPTGGAGANMLMFTPHAGSGDYRMSYAQASPGYLDEYVANGIGVLDNLGPVFVTCVYDPPHNTMSLYTNGVQVASINPATPKFSLTNVYNVHSWLGRSLYDNDSSYAGTMDEFRIFNSALGPLQVAVDNVAGPDTIVNNIAVNSIVWHANNSMVLGSRQDTTVTFNTRDYGSFTLKGSTEATYYSADPAIVSVNLSGQLFAMATGTVNVSAVYNNQTNTVAITVTAPTLQHRYSFTADANDSVGSANGTLMGAAFIDAGKVNLDGTGNSGAADANGAGYVDLPNDLLSTNTTVSIETWVTDNGSANWARVWDFGNSAGGEQISNGGTRYMFLSLPAGGGDLFGAIHVSDRAGGDQGLGWAGLGRPPAGKEVHIVWVTDAAHHTGWLYVDGALVGINTNMTLTPADIGSMLNVWLGRSQYNDPMFKGSIDEVRFWNGPLTPLQVAVEAATGPDAIGTNNPGTVQNVRLNISPSMIKGGRQNATTAADFSNISNVNVSTLGVIYTSSDTNVATIDAAGVITALSIGNTTIKADYGGKTDSKSLTVLVKPTVLAHRYSFSETSGTTVADSVGAANGTLSAAGATLDGLGSLTLDGASGYVDLPGHLIDGFDAVTVEAWVTVDPATLNDSNARLFIFGSVDAVNEIGLTARTGGGNTYVRYFSSLANVGMLRQKSLNTVGKVQLVAIFNAPLNTIDLYLNGHWQNTITNLSFKLSGITNTLSRLGANLAGTAFTGATFDEFRIYNGAMDLLGMRTSFAAGPTNVVSSPGLATALTVRLDSQMVQGSKQVPHATASYATVANVDVSQTSQLIWSSSDTNVIAITSDGLLQAAGIGSATVTGVFAGKTNSASITVFPKQTMLTHRYSYTTDAKDSVGGQDGYLWGNAQVNSGQVSFDGDMNSYVELPSRMISTYDSVSLELWASFGVNAQWSRVFDFGHYNDQADGGTQPYAFLCPHTGGTTTRVVLSDGTEAVLDFGPALDGLTDVHIVVVFDPSTNTQLMYTNGVLAGSASLNGKVLAGVNDTSCWLGRSMYRADNGLTANIDEFRIYAGALTPAQVTADFTAGPGTVVLPPPVSITKVTMSVTKVGNNLSIAWTPSAGKLYSAPSVDSNNWTLESSSNPAVVPIGTGTKFFRVWP